jgi:hypothetical protein
MKKSGHRSQKPGNGGQGRQNLKSRLGTSRKNGFVHVVSPATVSEIERALGITKTQKANVLRAFAAAGVKL